MKLVLTVIDGLRPSALERAVATGRAPALARLIERGTYVDACCAAFPSVTPVCAATIATGSLQDRHHIPSMNWWWRDERRYVEYGSSFGAARKLGINRQLVDTVYRMNMEHLAEDAATVFESLDDAGVRTAGTTYLMYRGRHEHRASQDTALTRIAGASIFRRPILGPKELFYADVYASRKTGCRSQLGMPGIRDQHAGCVGAYLAEHDLFDFLLLSLPDNDTHSHRHGPDAQVTSIHAADREIERVMHAAGGPDAFLDEHAIIVVADHSHALVEANVDLFDALSDFVVTGPGGATPDEGEIAVCPAQRSAMVYLLLDKSRAARAELLPRLLETLLATDGVDLVMHRQDNVAVVLGEAGALSFSPGEEVRDVRGGEWVVRGNLDVLDARVEDGVFRSEQYPDALARVWAALACPTSGEVLVSAAPGWEFLDWGGAAHIGGGSHGSLHRSDSLGALVMCGVDHPEREQWSIADIAALVRGHWDLEA